MVRLLFGCYIISSDSYLLYDISHTHINKDKKHSTIYIQDGLQYNYIIKTYTIENPKENDAMWWVYGGWGYGIEKGVIIYIVPIQENA